MPRRPRSDRPDSWHHVTNRAVARRPMFETRTDIRYFLAELARAVRRGQIEVNAWCVLTTHFHLLVKSPKGELSQAMRRIQNAYVRYFNRSRRRDGPLVRGRFLSKPVESIAYRRVLVGYIDANPVRAGLCTDPCAYPWGSARQYAGGGGPPWLSRSWVESEVAARAGAARYDPRDYPRSVDARAAERNAALVAARLDASDAGDDLDSLLGRAAPAVLQWLRRKARLADGAALRNPVVPAAAVTGVIAAFAMQHGARPVGARARAGDAFRVLHAGLLRDVAAETFVAVAARIGTRPEQARRLTAQHRRLLAADRHYGDVASRVVRAILDEVYGAQQQPDAPPTRVEEVFCRGSVRSG